MAPVMRPTQMQHPTHGNTTNSRIIALKCIAKCEKRSILRVPARGGGGASGKKGVAFITPTLLTPYNLTPIFQPLYYSTPQSFNP